MIKYLFYGATFKILSISPKIYRFLGNTLGKKWRMGQDLSVYHVRRAKRIVELCKRYQIREGDKLLELGTGWLHWESIIIRLFFDVKIVLFDIWDNRQLKPLQRFLSQYAKLIDAEICMNQTMSKRVHKYIKAISSVSSYDELYNMLDFEYILEPSGTLQHFQDETFDSVFSYNVLEHIDKNIVSRYVHDIYRILKPGRNTMHWIDISDHITNYARNASRKQYLMFSDALWKNLLENKVQYINRIQRSEWINLFQENGFEIVDENSLYMDIGNLKINKKYENRDIHDLECVSLDIIYRKQNPNYIINFASSD
jgi:cyclopropane fatty-acyl-phospholipid synthase-like methyltransferase